jgi:pimeloyl-ACP methyl ester carboxylesterase
VVLAFQGPTAGARVWGQSSVNNVPFLGFTAADVRALLPDNPDITVNRDFLAAYSSVFPLALSLLRDKAGLAPGAWSSGPVVALVGHGEGGGVAVLVAMALLKLGLSPARLHLITFGQPMVRGGGEGVWTDGCVVCCPFGEQYMGRAFVLAGRGVEAREEFMCCVRMSLQVLGEEAATSLNTVLRSNYLRVAHVQDTIVPTPVDADGAAHAGTEVRALHLRSALHATKALTPRREIAHKSQPPNET